MPTDEGQFLPRLKIEVEAELAITRSSYSADANDVSPAEWLFDPTDVEREEIGLRNLLGAVEAIERDVESDHSRDVERSADHAG